MVDTHAAHACQCGLWDTHPHTLGAQGLPRGYCGWCETCGAPGHTRHFPGTAPATGAWCDHHYRRLSIIHPLGHVGRRLYPLLALAAAALAIAIMMLR